MRSASHLLSRSRVFYSRAVMLATVQSCKTCTSYVVASLSLGMIPNCPNLNIFNLTPRFQLTSTPVWDSIFVFRQVERMASHWCADLQHTGGKRRHTKGLVLMRLTDHILRWMSSQSNRPIRWYHVNAQIWRKPGEFFLNTGDLPSCPNLFKYGRIFSVDEA